MGVRATMGKWGFLQLRARKTQKSWLGQQGGTFQAREGVDAQRAPEGHLRGAISRNPREASMARVQDRRQSKEKQAKSKQTSHEGLSCLVEESQLFSLG